MDCYSDYSVILKRNNICPKETSTVFNCSNTREDELSSKLYSKEPNNQMKFQYSAYSSLHLQDSGHLILSYKEKYS